jgi:WD40 repeat protein
VLARTTLLDGLPSEASAVLDQLAQGRLVIVRRSRDRAEDGDVELVHESLVHNWARLARWIDESKEDLAFAAELNQAAKLWDKRGRKSEEIWQGEALHDALRRAKRLSQPSALAMGFLTASQRRESLAQRRRRAALAVGIALLALLAVAASVVGVVVSGKNREIGAQKEFAETRRAEALQEGAEAALGAGRLLEARAKLRGALEVRDANVTRALWSKLKEEPLRWTTELAANVNAVAFSPDGRRVAAGCNDGFAYLLESLTGRATMLPRQPGMVRAVAFSHDGKLLALAGSGFVTFWGIEQNAALRTAKEEEAVVAVAFAPDDRTLATSLGRGVLRTRNVATAESLVRITADGGPMRDVAFSPDGKLLVTGCDDGSVRAWDPATLRETKRWLGHEQASAVSFAADGRALLSSGGEGEIRLWSLEAETPPRVVVRDPSTIFDAALSPNGRSFAVAVIGGSVEAWPSGPDDAPRTCRGHQASVRAIAYSPDGRHIASGSEDRTVRMWQAECAAADRRRMGHGGPVQSVAFAPGDTLLASASADTTTRLWNLRSGRAEGVLRGSEQPVLGVAFAADGNRLVTGAQGGEAWLWNVAQKHVEKRLPVTDGGTLSCIAISSDGTSVATCRHRDGTIKLWDVGTGGLRQALNPGDGAREVAFGPDGTELASFGSTQVTTWDVASGARRLRFRPPGRAPGGMRYLDDGRLLAWGWSQGDEPPGWIFWNVATGEQSATLDPTFDARESHVFSETVAANGTRAALGYNDGAARTIELPNGRKVSFVGHQGTSDRNRGQHG